MVSTAPGNGRRLLPETRPARREQHEDGQSTARKHLLVLQVAIRCDKQIEAVSLRPVQQLTVSECCPAQLRGRLDCVIGQMTTEWGGRALTEQNLHAERRLAKPLPGSALRARARRVPVPALPPKTIRQSSRT